MLKKLINAVITVLSVVVLIFDFIDIIDIKNVSLFRLLCVLLIIEIPINIYFFSLHLILKRKHIVIDNINMVTVDHEFNNYKDLIRQSKRFEVQSVSYIYEFIGSDFKSIRTYKGKCSSRHKATEGFPLVVAGDNNSTFAEIDCYAYDLIEDATRSRKLYPELMSNEGLYKFACYRFRRPLRHDQEFHIEAHYTWPDCVSSEKDYILASPIFDKKCFNHFDVELRFFDDIPIRVKRYMINEYKKITFQGEILRDAIQKAPESYVSFTDTGIEMKDNIAFFVYVYDFVN